MVRLVGLVLTLVLLSTFSTSLLETRASFFELAHSARLMEANQIRIIYTLDMERFGKINWIKAVNPIPEDKTRELRVFLKGSV